jgi:hypothetical protein
VKSGQLRELEKLARLKADRELKKFRALRAHVEAAQQRVDASRAAMAQSYAAEAPLSVAEARLANAQAGRAARELARAHVDLRKLEPQIRTAQMHAARAFGRAEAVRELGETLERRHCQAILSREQYF